MGACQRASKPLQQRLTSPSEPHIHAGSRYQARFFPFATLPLQLARRELELSIERASTEPEVRGADLSAELPWIAVLAVTGVLALIVLWFPVIRTFTHYEINYNEGWNAYRARLTDAGVPLYKTAPRYNATNYPPLSFHLMGFLARFTEHEVDAGRYISLLSLLAIALLIAAIVRVFTQTRMAGAFAGLIFIVWLTLYAEDRVGMNDPQLLATVVSLAGLYVYLKRPEAPGWLCASAALFGVSVFTKHNLLAFPLAVAAHLLLTAPFRRFSLWVGAGVVAAGALFGATNLIDGPYFLAHLTLGRPWSLHNAASSITAFFQVFQIPFAAAIIWSVWSRRNRAWWILPLALISAEGIAFGFAGGYGVVENIYFDSIIALAIITGVAAGDIASATVQRFGKATFAAVLCVALLSTIFLLPERIAHDVRIYRAFPSVEDRFAEAVEFVAQRPGPALCASPLVCFEAGKEQEFDAYTVASQVAIGKISVEDILSVIDIGYYRTIVLDAGEDNFRDIRPLGPVAQRIMERYRIALRAGRYTIWIPAA